MANHVITTADDPVTFSSPWKSVTVAAGDTVEIQSGTYTDLIKFDDTIIGTSGSPIVVSNSGGQVNVTENSGSWSFLVDGSEWVEFNFDGHEGTTYGLKLINRFKIHAGIGISLNHADISNANGIGVHIAQQAANKGTEITDITIEDCHIHDCNGEAVYAGNTRSSSPASDEYILRRIYQRRLTVADCYEGPGINSCHDWEIVDCTVTDTDPHDDSAHNAAISIGKGANGPGLCSRNTINGCTGYGIAINVSDNVESSATTIEVSYNSIHNVGTETLGGVARNNGIHLSSAIPTVNIFNNTVTLVGNGTDGYGIRIADPQGFAYNNICVDTEDDGISLGAGVPSGNAHHNLSNISGQSLDSTAHTPTSIKFIDYANDDFHIESDSPAVGVASDGGDVGAFSADVTISMDTLALTLIPQDVGVSGGVTTTPPSLVGTAVETNDGAGDVLATMPASIVSGELLIVHIAYDQGAEITTPSGWTEANQAHTDGEAMIYVGYRTADGTESSTYTFAADRSDGSLAWAFRVEDHDGIDVVSTVSAGNDSSPIAPSVTTTVNNCLVINFVSMDGNGSSPFTSPDTEIYDNGNRGVGIVANYFTQATAGATGTKSFTASASGHWRTMTIAIAPEPGASIILMQTLGIDAVAQSATLSFGEVTITPNTLALTAAAQGLTVDNPITVSLDTLALAATPQSLTVVPAEATITPNTLTLTATAQALTVDGTTTVSLNTLALTATAVNASIAPGETTITLNTLALATSAESLSVEANTTIALNTLALASSAESASIVPSAATITPNTLALTAAAQSATIDAGGAEPYKDKAVTIGLGPLYPLNESSGTTADNYEGTAVYDGTYSGGYTLADTAGPDGGDGVAHFDGTNSLVDITDADAAFDGAELTISLWIKLASGTWSDFATRQAFKFTVDGSNYVQFGRPFNTGYLRLSRAGGGTVSTYDITGLTTTDWIHIGITVSETDDEIKVYQDGTLLTTLTSIGTWAGSLSSTGAVIGSSDTSVPSQSWKGHISYFGFTDEALSASNIADLADASGAAGVNVSLDTLALSVSAQSLAVVPAETIITPNTLALTAAPQDLSVGVGITVSMSTLSLTAAAQNASIVPAETTVNLNTLTITATAQDSTIGSGVVVSLNTLALTATPQSTSLALGIATITLNTLTLTAIVQALTVASDATVISLDTLALTAAPQSLTVVPAETAIDLDTLALALAPQSAVIAPSETTISMSTLQLTAAAISFEDIGLIVDFEMIDATASDTALYAVTISDTGVYNVTISDTSRV